MKHKITVQLETKKHFLGIPYKAVEKKRITVDGKSYRKMQREEQERQRKADDEALACAMVVWEEEMVDIFGE